MAQSNKKSPISGTYKESLEKLGYRLTDNGDSWRTSANYRGGKNPTSILIYKNSGVWYDFGQAIGPIPYRKLVALTLNSDDPDEIEKFLVEAQEFVAAPQNEYIEMSKIYPDSVLNDLLPTYKFYLDRNIPEEVLKMYKCGFAGSGKMYRRIVFPIVNQHRQIHGFSGRKIDLESESPKWFHMGKRREWVYPLYTTEKFFDNAKEIILVESIGDSLALSANGIHNHLVLFGLKPSSAVLGFLLALAPDKITIALNNDLNGDINRGQLAAVKTYLSLSKLFDRKKLQIKLPLLNDFGEMQENKMQFYKWFKQPDGTKEALALGVKLMDNPKVVFSGEQRKALTKLCNGQK